MIQCGERDLYVLEMDAEGFEEEESPLEGLVTGKYGITNSCADVWIWDNFESLHLTEVKWRFFPSTFGMFRSKILVPFRKIFVSVKFIFYLGVKELIDKKISYVCFRMCHAIT